MSVRPALWHLQLRKLASLGRGHSWDCVGRDRSRRGVHQCTRRESRPGRDVFWERPTASRRGREELWKRGMEARRSREAPARRGRRRRLKREGIGRLRRVGFFDATKKVALLDASATAVTTEQRVPVLPPCARAAAPTPDSSPARAALPRHRRERETPSPAHRARAPCCEAPPRCRAR
jgi:hypothetical protein